MIRTIHIAELMEQTDAPVLIDVRSPAEFEHAHIPGAFNVPLFSNEERAQVGTTYKQVGREEAILLGFDLAGPKWSGFIKQCLELAPGKKLAVHCWRGGMRSGAMAWALNMYGFEVSLLSGGYKAYRQWARGQFERNYRISVLGGMTGSGKTRLLHLLKADGYQVIDLEDLAQHQGSAYGSMNRMVQPSQEQFENNLAGQLQLIDPNRELWLEDESSTIGKCRIPESLWHQMRNTRMIDLQVPLEQRVAMLVKEYGTLDKDFLIEGTERIHKRLGPEQTRDAIAAIREDRMADFIQLVLVYYDKSYRKGLGMRNPAQVFQLEISGSDAAADKEQLAAFAAGRIPQASNTLI